jgi:origin recognition complex subunit 4
VTLPKTSSLGDNIDFLRAMLAALARAHKVPVFLLDDFDAFARRPKQTLLYCLLDALQTSGVQAVVVGTTCRHDCLDLLEKRVKSRFSHRTVEVVAPRRAAPRERRPPEDDGGVDAGDPGCDGAIDVLRGMLTLPEEASAERDGGGGGGAVPAAHAAAHNAAVEAALAEPGALEALDRFVACRPNLREVGALTAAALAAAARQGPGGLPARGAVAAAAAALSEADGATAAAVAGLSVLQAAVLVAAHRVAGRAAGRGDRDALNFEMVHHEFRSYVGSGGDHVDNHSRGAAAKAFERLAALGLLSPADGRGGGGGGGGGGVAARQYAAVQVQVAGEELRAGLDAHPTCPARLRNWLAREGGLGTTAAAMY